VRLPGGGVRIRRSTPPELVRLLRAHIKKYGTTPDGRIF
jgi:hypothetical protein